MVVGTNAAMKASYKRCLIRKQGDCRQRKKEETKGAETTLSRLWVISENITAVAFLSAPGAYFNTVSAFKGNNSLPVTKQQWVFFSVLPFSVTQEFSAKQGLKYELSLRLIQKHSLPPFVCQRLSHICLTIEAQLSIEIKWHCFKSGQFSHFIAVRGRMLW